MKSDRFETVVQVLILLAIAGMAGAASFTHVHDWTMRNAPPGTGTWFGWANAVISDLTPTAAGIEIRRRKRHGHASVAYPMTVLIAAALLSLTAQVADARPTLAGWITAAVPALAFLALTKLILSRPAGNKDSQQSCAKPVLKTDAPGITATVAPSRATSPATASAPSTAGSDAHEDLRPVPSGQLFMSARMTAFAHQQETGNPITPGELATRMNIPPALARSLTDHLGGTGTPPPVTAVNGTPPGGGDRP